VILSRTAVYALKATLCLADPAVDGPLRVDDIAERLDVPRNYLSKILHVLARNRVLESTRGPGGGFTLRVAPDRVPLSDIVRHFDTLTDDSACLLGKERCSDSDPCPAHAEWKSVARSVQDFFSNTTLADLAKAGAGTLCPEGPIP